MSGQPVDTLRYAIDGDLAPFRAKAAQVDAEASRLGDSVKAKTAHAFDGATAGATKLGNQLKLTANQYRAFAKEAADTGKSVESLIAAHFRAGSAAEAAAKKSVAAKAAERAAIKAAANDARIAAEEALRRQRAASPNAIPLRGHQITNLSQQVQDFFIGMGSGQNPLTVIMQQTPQTVSAVGGIGNAFKLMGGAAGVARLAVGGLAVGIGATLVTAFVKGQNEAAGLERRLALIGGAAGVTRGQIEMMSRSVEGVGRGAAREIMGGLAAGGNTPSGSLVQATQLTRDFARATGSSNEDATKFWNEILDKPAEGARKLAEDFNALSAAQVREIESLVASGQTRQAVDIIIQNAGQNFQSAADQVGYLESAARMAGGALGDFWSFLKGIGRPETPEEELARMRRGTGGSFGYNPGIERLQEQVDRRAAAARAQEQRAADNQLLLGASSTLGPFAVEQTRARQRRESVAQAQAVLGAAQRQGDAEAITLAQTALRNAQNPNYRPGSGVPQGRTRRPQVDTGARDAELARMEVANARALAATPLRDREALRARQQAEAEFVRNNADPRRQSNAAGIRDSRNATFEINQADRRRQVVVAVQEEVTAQQKLAAAYLLSTAAGAAQVTQGQAHAAAIQGLIENEDEYTRVLNERAFAQAQVNDAQARQQRALGNQALARLAAANGNPAGLEAAQIENDALSQTQAIRDQAQAMLESAKSAEEEAIAKERLAAAEQALNAARRQGQETAGYNRQMVQAANDNRAREAIQIKEVEVRLAYANAEALAMEMAAIRAYHQAVAEGETPGTTGFDDRYAKILKLNQEAAKLDLILSGQTDSGKVIDNVRAGLEDIGMAATRGFDSARDAAAGFFRQLGDLIVQLYVIKPLLNGLMGEQKGGGGGLMASIGKAVSGGGSGGGSFWSTAANAAMSFFGGFRADGGPTQPGKAYIVGERGPELFAPDMAGNVIPIRPPSSQTMQSSQAATHNLNMAFTIDVAGANGDAAVAAIARQASTEAVKAGLQAYDMALNGSLSQRIRLADRRRVG